MFLAEVALGKEHGITKDDSALRTAPKGFDSVVARGRIEPGFLSFVNYLAFFLIACNCFTLSSSSFCFTAFALFQTHAFLSQVHVSLIHFLESILKRASSLSFTLYNRNLT